jgi:superfamily II DNA helicase RecQ
MFFYEEGADSQRRTQPTRTMQTPQMTSAQTTPAIPASHAAPLDSGPPLTGEQGKWIMALKKWRAEQAEQEGVPLYMVAQNRWLEDIVRMPARVLDDLMKVRGLGEWRVQKYGAKILETLNAANSAKRPWQRPASYPSGRA